MLVDSHCHLDFDSFDEDRSETIQRAFDAGVGTLVTICTHYSKFENIVAIAELDTRIYCSVGIHPHQVEEEKAIKLDDLLDAAKNPKVIGIGETGLDYFYDQSPREDQQSSFRTHIAAARETQMPLIVHTRSAENDTYDILKSEMKNKDLKVLIHCFTGTKNFAHKLIDIGCYISASGVVTFKKSKDLADTFLSLPNDRILVETDSPYLSPEPLRGKSNEPSHIIHTVNFLARLKGIQSSLFAKKTSSNFFKLFGQLN